MVDNLTDAIMMAGAVLIFIIALTTSMSTFTTMRSQIDNIIEYDYKLDLVTDSEGNYINYHTSNSDIRTVGVETIVSSMYRVKQENFVIYIILDLSGDHIDDRITQEEITINKVKTNAIKISIDGDNWDIEKILNEYGLYNKMKDKKFKEYLGVYQIETDGGVDEINKTTYRVITYEEVK